jgi:arylsulfatase A-like enzyme
MIWRMRSNLWSLLGLLAVLGTVTGCGVADDGAGSEPDEASAIPSAPDLFVIVLDSLRADAVEREIDGRAVMPNVRQWSESHLVFTQAQASSASTPTSVSALLTSLPVPAFRGDFLRGIPSGATSVAEVLSEAGYLTLAYSANPNCSATLGHDRGFDRFVEAYSSPALATGVRLRKDHPARIVEPGVLLQTALDDLDPTLPQPVFVYLHLLQPHAPYAPPDAHRRLFVGPDLADVPLDLPTLARSDARRENPPAWNAPLRRHYDGHSHWVDQAVGVFLRALEAHERYARAGVLVLSDHGEAFGEHGRILHNTTTFEEMIRIPLVLKTPGQTASPGRVEAPVDLIDVAPTLCALAGIEPAQTFQGLDLLSVTRDPSLALSRALLSVSIEPDAVSYRQGANKLIRELEDENRSALFDLESDPGEKTDLSERDKTLRASLDRELDEELARLESLAVGRAEPRSLEEEQLEILRSLGYVIDEDSR